MDSRHEEGRNGSSRMDRVEGDRARRTIPPSVRGMCVCMGGAIPVLQK